MFKRIEPIITFFAIWETIFKVERRIGEDFAAVGADEALRVKGLAHCFQAILEKCLKMILHSVLCISNKRKFILTNVSITGDIWFQFLSPTALHYDLKILFNGGFEFLG